MFKDAGDGTLRFKKDIDYNAVKAKNDEKLMALWRKSKRYDGKGCMDAVEHVETVLADAFRGKRLASLGSLLETYKALLGLELEQARDDLEVVLDPVVDLLQEPHLLVQCRPDLLLGPLSLDSVVHGTDQQGGIHLALH